MLIGGRLITSVGELSLARMAFEKAKEIAKNSNCKRELRGSVIIDPTAYFQELKLEDAIVGLGFNRITELNHQCVREEDWRKDFCYGIHAAEEAIDMALTNGFASKLKGAKMFNVKLNLTGCFCHLGFPCCTTCAKKIAKFGISVILFHKTGITLYNPEEFLKISMDNYSIKMSGI